MIDGVAAAYSATGGLWQSGPGRVYDRLAAVVLSWSPVSVRGSHLLDAGAGTGAVSRAALAAGAARVTAVDAAVGMLAHDAARRPPAAVADIRSAPFATATFDAAVAAFSLNHDDDPAAGLREMSRVTRSGGILLAASYAADDGHPVKEAVGAALADHGWAPEPWHDALRDSAIPLLATPDGCAAVMRDAGVAGDVEPIRVSFPDLEVADLVAWRLGMAQHAPFVATLTEGERQSVFDEAVAQLGRQVPPLVRSILMIRAFNP